MVRFVISLDHLCKHYIQ